MILDDYIQSTETLILIILILIKVKCQLGAITTIIIITTLDVLQTVAVESMILNYSIHKSSKKCVIYVPKKNSCDNDFNIYYIKSRTVYTRDFSNNNKNFP